MTTPAEHCGHQPDVTLSQPTECVLRPGHTGSHADETGMRWWKGMPNPAQPQQAECLLDACIRACTTECREAINRAWASLRGELPPATVLAPAEPIPLSETEEVRGGRRLTEPAQPRHTADSITDDALTALYDRAEIAEARARELDGAANVAVSAIRLMNQAGAERDQLRATAQRLNRRAQRAESENNRYRRAVAQWDVSERGTYIPHASLAAIGRAAGIDVFGSVRHLKHFQRVEQAEAAVIRAEAERDAARNTLDRVRDVADGWATTAQRYPDSRLSTATVAYVIRTALDPHQTQETP